MADGSFWRRAKRFLNLREGRASHAVIRRRIVEGNRINGIHLATLMVAMLIASVGLNADSSEAVIGAMLICPLMGSVLASGYAIAAADRTLLHEAILALLLQMAICLTTSSAYFLISPVSGETSALLTNANPTIWDILIALAGGFAGAIGYSRQQEPATLIAGVAVATALMPPLCTAGYGIATRDLAFVLTALYKLGINVVFIAFSAEAVFMLLRVPLVRDIDEDGVPLSLQEQEEESRLVSRKLKRNLTVGTILFAIPCILMSLQVVRATGGQADVALVRATDAYDTTLTARELAVVCPDFDGYAIGERECFDPKDGSLDSRLVATVTTTSELDEERRQEVEKIIALHVKGLDHVEFVVAADVS